MISHLGVVFMCILAPYPLGFVRGLGYALGVFLYWVVWPRRKVVDVNLRLCFPHWSAQERRRVTRRVFIHVAQSFLDRA